MDKNITEKIISSHLIEGQMVPGDQIGLSIDHTLTQDSTGTLAYLEFEAMGVPQVKTKLSLSFVDHNMLQNDYRNADDHKYLQAIAEKYGIVFSRPGNGICHQLYLERFSKPGYTLLGSDSHTPTGGGMGMIAIGAGGLDVAAAMAGEAFFLEMPSIIGIKLEGSLSPFVSAKDVILSLLKKLTVKGGVNKILEYFGPGIETLSIPERGTITNMGTETGATTSIFPSDEVTKLFLQSQGRDNQWLELKPDKNASYSELIELNLSELEPQIALPHSPDNVKTVKNVEGLPVDQVCIGSCTNSSLRDLKMVASLLKNRKIHDHVSLTISPGSRQVLEHLVSTGELLDILKAGARVIENGCGPCIGIGQAPPTDAVTLRTFNRNFKGRSGTQNAKIFLVSPETAIASAIYGKITDPRKLKKYPKLNMPEKMLIDDNLFIFPSTEPHLKKIMRGPNIKPLPDFLPLPNTLTGEVLLKTRDNTSTDDILPGGSEVMSLRSNIPEISKHVFRYLDSLFSKRALKKGGGFIIGGENYGQGSSREHAALAPKYLGVKAIIAKSFARIHQANLVNFGILPLTLISKQDYKRINQGDILSINVKDLENIMSLTNVNQQNIIRVSLNLSDREKRMIKAGGKLAAIRSKQTNY
ncbi:MAG TPA: aconitate hydratase [Candidatus Glassbacteria bacterium]|nr:aconitate hydratase [Candidatus Glassbacteria bacterium]